MQQQIKDAEARQAVLAARQAAANRSGVGYRSSRDHSGSGGYGGSDKRSADNRSSDLGFSDIRLKDNIEKTSVTYWLNQLQNLKIDK